MLIVVRLNSIYYFHKVYQHLKLAIVHVISHLLFFVFKYLLIFSHFLHLSFHRLVFDRLYTNFIQFLLAHSILFLPYLLFFSNQLFSFKDLLCKLTFLLFLIFDRLIFKNLFKISLLFNCFYFLIHLDLFLIVFLNLLFLKLIFEFNFLNFRYQFFSLIP